MQPTVLLFDIDGTLVTTGGVGRRALVRAFGLRYGREDACDFRLDGMTDRAIFRQGLLAIGEKCDVATLDAMVDAYLALLVEEVANASPDSYRLHPGMRRAVELAGTKSQCAVGLGTGNVRPGAKIKLDRVDIYQHFPFGGFGCDHENRTELIRAGAQRGAERLGAPLEECRVVVIGDTPKDVAAARGIGAECVGVGTGAFSAQDLIDCGAHVAYPDLEADGAIAYLLGR